MGKNYAPCVNRIDRIDLAVISFYIEHPCSYWLQLKNSKKVSFFASTVRVFVFLL